MEFQKRLNYGVKIQRWRWCWGADRDWTGEPKDPFWVMLMRSTFRGVHLCPDSYLNIRWTLQGWGWTLILALIANDDFVDIYWYTLFVS